MWFREETQDSIQERLGDLFVEATVKMGKSRQFFLQRVTYKLVKGLVCSKRRQHCCVKLDVPLVCIYL